MIRHEFHPAGETRAREGRSLQRRVRELRAHPRRAPFRELGGEIAVRSRLIDPDEVGAADVGGNPQVHQHVVEGVGPVGFEEESLG